MMAFLLTLKTKLVAIGGLAVCSGDIIVGDRDGVVVVPLARAAEVIATLATVKKKEAAMDAAVRGGLKAPDWQAAMLASDRVHYLDRAGA